MALIDIVISKLVDHPGMKANEFPVNQRGQLEKSGLAEYRNGGWYMITEERLAQKLTYGQMMRAEMEDRERQYKENNTKQPMPRVQLIPSLLCQVEMEEVGCQQHSMAVEWRHNRFRLELVRVQHWVIFKSECVRSNHEKDQDIARPGM